MARHKPHGFHAAELSIDRHVRKMLNTILSRGRSGHVVDNRLEVIYLPVPENCDACGFRLVVVTAPAIMMAPTELCPFCSCPELNFEPDDGWFVAYGTNPPRRAVVGRKLSPRRN
jgi:hypothetical protein